MEKKDKLIWIDPRDAKAAEQWYLVRYFGAWVLLIGAVALAFVIW